MQRIVLEAASRATKPFVVLLAALALVGGSYAAAAVLAKPPPAAPPAPNLTATPPFTLGGSLASPLYPGAQRALDVRIDNPFSFDIHVSGLTVTVRRATARDGQPNPACDGTVNLKVLRQYGGPTPLLVPGQRSVTLSGLGVPQSQWPQLQMPDLPVNQDACKRTTFTFDYAATATKVNR
jgi:hypothetical protein